MKTSDFAKPILKKMMVQCIKQQCQMAIAERKRHGDPHQHPLFAWIKGAPNIPGKSRIQCVLDNQARWPWYTKNAAGYEFKRRIIAKKNLSFVQIGLLETYIEMRFNGRYTWHDDVTPQNILVPKEKKLSVSLAGQATYKFVHDCLYSCGVNRHKNMPLRLILSEEFCILINLVFMEHLLKLQKFGSCWPSKQWY